MESKQTIRMLLVEDLAADAELITRSLTRAGASLATRRVESRESLLRELADFQPHIVLSDFTLPGFDGLEALGLVREHGPDLPFVFVSGTLGEDRAIEALKRGATDYVLKSNLSRLPSAVSRALEEAANLRARRAAEDELRRSERRLRDIVESSQDWIWEMDAEGRFTFSNGAVQAILGIAVDEVLGRNQQGLLHPDEVPRAAELLPDPAAGRPSLRTVRARWRHRDGSHRWLERSATAVTGPGGAAVGYRGNDRDVTRQLEHESRIARLNRVQMLLSSVNAAAARARERGPLLQEICRLAVDRGGYARAIVALQDAPDTDPRPVAWHGEIDGTLETLLLPLGVRTAREQPSLARLAIRDGRPAVLDEIEGRSPGLRHQAELHARGVRAVAALPLRSDSQALGVLTLESREPHVFDTDELALLGEIATEIVQSLQSIRREETLHFLSWYDPLTQLSRRELFCERLALLCSGEPDSAAAVVTVNLERIGIVNDSLGRETGDEMLRLAANRLRTHFGNPDRLAYLGGSTFALALAGADADPAGIAQVRNQLREIFGEVFTIGESEIDMQIRTGVARYPSDAGTPAELVQNAETALRRAKTSGVDDYDYTITLNRELADRMLTGQRLHRALGQEQFLLHYQPVVELDTGRIVGGEALLRWSDPGRGLVPPTQFIPLLEESGQIVDVGQWVLERVARDAGELQRTGAVGLRLAVNISPLQLRRPDFVERLLQTASEVDAHGNQLEIEITESMLMQDLEASVEKLSQLRQAGIRISIDDFGTGYSSLSLLARLPIDCLKIDRGFITPLADDPASMTVVSTVIGLARAFRLGAVAEGVETAEQLKLLRLMKCDLGQGYRFGRPVPLVEFRRQLSEPPAKT